MPAFKHKTTKQLLSDNRNITTLDSVHKEKQAEFNYIKTVVIPELKNEKLALKAQLKPGSGSNDIITPMSLETRLEKKDRVAEITALIREHAASIKTYYLNNNKYIFSYFETKKEISNTGQSSAQSTAAYAPNVSESHNINSNNNNNNNNNNNSNSSSSSNINSNSNNNNNNGISTLSKTQIINSFFKIATVSVSNDSQEINAGSQQSQHQQSHHQPQPISKHDLYKLNCTNVQQYLHNVDHSFIDLDRFTYRTDICAQCQQGEMVPIDSEGILVCNKCSSFIVYFTENEKPSYKEPPKEACFTRTSASIISAKLLRNSRRKKQPKSTPRSLPQSSTRYGKNASRWTSSPTRRPRKFLKSWATTSTTSTFRSSRTNSALSRRSCPPSWKKRCVACSWKYRARTHGFARTSASTF